MKTLFQLSALAFVVGILVAPARTEESVNYLAYLEVEGAILAYFQEVSGLGSETEVVEQIVVNSSGQQVIKKLPGRLKWQDITLKHGLSGTLHIRDWRAQVENGDIQNARKNGAIVFVDASYNPVAKWTFTKGWPSHIHWSVGMEGAFEELVIVHEGLTRVN